MKTVIKITFFVLAFIFLLGIKGVKAHDEFTRVIKKEFAVNPDKFNGSPLLSVRGKLTLKSAA